MQNGSSPKKRPLVNRLMSASLNLTAPQKWTLVCLFDHQNNKNGTKVWPGIDRLVGMTGFSDRTVRRALHDLEQLGFFNADRHTGGKNIYYLNIEMAEKYIGQSDRSKGDRPVRVTDGIGQSDRTPRSERPMTPVTVAAEQSKEPVKNSGNLTGSARQPGKVRKQNGSMTAREQCLVAVGKILDDTIGSKHDHPKEVT